VGVANQKAQLGFKHSSTAQYFRSSLRDWAAETTSYPRELVETALAHTVESMVKAAYRRGDLLQNRRALMQDWAKFLERTVLSTIRSTRCKTIPAASFIL
jgi:hypothetical protein